MDDAITHDALDTLLNSGTDTDVTQEGMHNGSDDARSVIVNEYTVILPTYDELSTFTASPGYATLPASLRAATIWSADRVADEQHDAWFGGRRTPRNDTNDHNVFFEVQSSPTFGTATILPQIYTAGTTITTLTLPLGTGGTDSLAYTLTPTASIPAGLNFDPATRELSGTPTTTTGTTATLTYTVTDSATPPRTASLTFTATVSVLSIILTPTSLTLTEGATATYTAVLDTLPTSTVTVTIAGDGDVTPAPPTLMFTTGNWNAAQSVVLTAGEDTDAVQDVATLTHTAAGGNYAGVAVNLAVTVTDDDTPPTFAAGAGILDQRYAISEAITTLELPQATGGIGTLSYTLTPLPGGLALNARTLSGTPSEIVTRTMIYTVTDMATRADGVTPAPLMASLNFTLTVARKVSATANTATAMTLPDGEAVGYVTLPVVGNLLAGIPPQTVAPAPPGLMFSLTVDIALTDAAGDDLSLPTPATVCLPTTDIPAGSDPVLFHYPSGSWEEIGRDTATRAGFVCGETTTFSPFAVGSFEIADARLSAISQVILPEVARAITDTTVSAIARRLHHAGADSHEFGSVTLGGQSTLADILTTGGQALADGTLNLHTMLGRSAFVLPLNQAGDLVQGLTLWGGGDYRAIGGSGDATDWDGALFSARLGADARVRANLLTGAALSWTQGDFEYGALADDPTAGGGDYTLRMTSLTPYVGWSVVPAGGLDVWATAGYGWGEVSITDTIVDALQTSDATTVMVGGGVSAQVLKTRTSRVRVKGELMQTSMDLDGHDRLGALTVEARRARLQVEGRHEHELAGGGRLGGTLEAGLRRDGGDGLTGTGAEMGGGVQYRHPAQGVTLSGQGRVLLGHTSNYEDWGIGAALTVIPGKGGEGLALRLSPTYGQTVTNTAQLWDQSAATLTGTDAAAVGQRMNAEVGYGLAIADGQNLLTPYGKLTWGQGTRDYRLGSRLTLASGLNLSLESRRGETPGAAADHGVLLNVVWGW